MATYKSKFSGVQIDNAVAYFLGVNTAGRDLQKFEVYTSTSGQTVKWATSTSDEDKKLGRYYVDITMTGNYTISGTSANNPSPLVYFIQNDTYGSGSSSIGAAGQKWEIDYKFSAASGSTNYNKCRAYSNLDVQGMLVIVTTLSSIPASS